MSKNELFSNHIYLKPNKLNMYEFKSETPKLKFLKLKIPNGSHSKTENQLLPMQNKFKLNNILKDSRKNKSFIGGTPTKPLFDKNLSYINEKLATEKRLIPKSTKSTINDKSFINHNHNPSESFEGQDKKYKSYSTYLCNVKKLKSNNTICHDNYDYDYNTNSKLILQHKTNNNTISTCDQLINNTLNENLRNLNKLQLDINNKEKSLKLIDEIIFGLTKMKAIISETNTDKENKNVNSKNPYRRDSKNSSKISIDPIDPINQNNTIEEKAMSFYEENSNINKTQLNNTILVNEENKIKNYFGIQNFELNILKKDKLNLKEKLNKLNIRNVTTQPKLRISKIIKERDQFRQGNVDEFANFEFVD